MNKNVKNDFMEMKNCTPNLMVKSVKQTVAFYVETLGFTLVDSVPSGEELVFAIVKNGDILFMFQEESSLKEEYPQLEKFPQGGGLTFYIHVEDIQSLYSQLKGKAVLAKDLHDTFYGSTDFAIEDCNGYILTFSQEKN